MDNHFDFLSYFSSYTISISENGDRAEIQNPFGNDNVIIHYKPNGLPYTAIFPFFHYHLENAEEVIEYLDNYISGKFLCFAWTNNRITSWSIEVTPEQVKDLSIETLVQILNPSGRLKNLFHFTNSVHIRGWHPKDNFDGMILRDAGGKWFLRKAES